MNFCIFEADNLTGLQPLVYFRPVYHLQCGTKSLLDLFQDYLPRKNIYLHLRPELENIFYPNFPKNQLPDGDTIFINGCLVADQQLKQLIQKVPIDNCFAYQGIPLIAHISAKNLTKIKLNKLLTLASFSQAKIVELPQKLPTKFIQYPWDIFLNNSSLIDQQVKRLTKFRKRQSKIPFTVRLFAKKIKNIYLGKNVIFGKNVVLDASQGAIYLADNVKVMPGVVIVGPVFIGENSLIKAGAKIYPGVTIGKHCKIGGEVEDSTISDYCNKQHEGFLGHSYLGSWVNLGAGTENSDLKNNYSFIKIKTATKTIITDQRFLGVIIGDHTKTGIKTMFNSGSLVGPFCNIFGSGFQKKYIAPFSWGNSNGKLEKHDLKKALQTAEIVMQRRKVILTKELQSLYKKIYMKGNQ